MELAKLLPNPSWASAFSATSPPLTVEPASRAMPPLPNFDELTYRYPDCKNESSLWGLAKNSGRGQ